MAGSAVIGWALLFIMAAIVTAPFIAEASRPRVTDKDRARAPGQTANLPNGPTYFQWRGPKGGPVAVCVHGLTTPSFVWGPLADHLAHRGFRVLTYDLYGRGLSARPKGAQNTAFFNEQLAALLDHEGINGKVTLLGYSMGGAVASGFAAQHPDRVRELCLLAPAGLGHDLGPIADIAAKWPYFGKWMMLGIYPRSLRRATAAERGLPSAIPEIVDLQVSETRKRGFAPAVLSSLSELMQEDFEATHRRITAEQIPTLAIWGETDDIIPLSGRNKLKSWNPDARNIVVDGAGHTLAYTDVDRVSVALDTLQMPV